MRYYIRINNEKGKIVGLGANEYLDIDIVEGNNILANLTLRPDDKGNACLYNENDTVLDLRG